MDFSSRIHGCLLGGAVGDALGYVVEFERWDAIAKRFGASGLRDFGQLSEAVPFSDDTQMTLFSVDGLADALQWAREGVRADELACIWLAYLRWLRTQGEPLATGGPEPLPSWLEKQEIMNRQQAPGKACLSGLSSPEMGSVPRPVNPQSKGCGTVMRAAPFGLVPQMDSAAVYRLSRDAAALTHGHPSALQSAAHFSLLIHALASGSPLTEAVAELLQRVEEDPAHAVELLERLQGALALAEGGPVTPQELSAALGEGWVAEEAFGIALYAVLATKDAATAQDHFRQALAVALNHDGDSDSSASIAGNILGTLYGDTVVPQAWLEGTTGIEVVRHMAGLLSSLVSE